MVSLKAVTIDKLKELAESTAKTNPPYIVALCGELGSGKTTFTQFFGSALGVSSAINSPTYTIHAEYKCPSGGTFHHIDLYRVETLAELKELKLENITPSVILSPDLSGRRIYKNIIVIEWADKFEEYIKGLSKGMKLIWIKFEHSQDPKLRNVYID